MAGEPVTPVNGFSAPPEAAENNAAGGNKNTQEIFDQAIEQIMTSVISNSLNQMQTNMQDAQSDNG